MTKLLKFEEFLNEAYNADKYFTAGKIKGKDSIHYFSIDVLTSKFSFESATITIENIVNRFTINKITIQELNDLYKAIDLNKSFEYKFQNKVHLSPNNFDTYLVFDKKANKAYFNFYDNQYERQFYFDDIKELKRIKDHLKYLTNKYK